MKHLLSGAAIAALLAMAVPATAQTTSDTTSKRAASDAMSSGKHAGKHMTRTARSTRGTAEDTSANELNRRELDRLAQTGTPSTGPGAGTTTAPARAAPRQ